MTLFSSLSGRNRTFAVILCSFKCLLNYKCFFVFKTPVVDGHGQQDLPCLPKHDQKHRNTLIAQNLMFVSDFFSPPTFYFINFIAFPCLWGICIFINLFFCFNRFQPLCAAISLHQQFKINSDVICFFCFKIHHTHQRC